ncbi:MAG TPA: hypothetical protein VF902_05970 [Coriobacteriia bacterium]
MPQATLEWLQEPDNPAVAVLTRRTLFGLEDDHGTTALWKRRNDYAPVAAILDAIRDDGSWDVPSRDYQKYRGSLWQIHFLGELHASGDCHRVQRGAAYAFSRQLPDGSWSCNGRPAASIPCLTANVGRALARLGFEHDERVVGALRYCVDLHRAVGTLDCGSIYSQTDDALKGGGARTFTLNGYCHMLAPKLLLFLSEVPRDLWPEGAESLRDECVAKLRDKHIFRCLPAEAREFGDAVWSLPSGERGGLRERFLAEHPDLHYKEKPGWLRFGYPLSYNSDVLEALRALAAAGEARRLEYEPALEVVASAADARMRWKMRNSLNGKMFADIEVKGAPSKWLTLHALQVLAHFGE